MGYLRSGPLCFGLACAVFAGQTLGFTLPRQCGRVVRSCSCPQVKMAGGSGPMGGWLNNARTASIPSWGQQNCWRQAAQEGLDSTHGRGGGWGGEIDGH
ncbi:unnamed protein product, partial [Choristocarpus tenellus]